MTKSRWFIAAVLLTFTLTGVHVTTADDDNDRPSAEQEKFADEVYQLMFKELVAALFTEFDDTIAHPENVEQGKEAISLIFHNKNRNMRLVGAFTPLLGGSNNFPGDDFEKAALKKALRGQEHRNVERVAGQWYLRRSFPLNNALHPACVLCHTNFPPNQGSQWVGALMQRVPIETDDNHNTQD
jgi:hypothetical protein